MQIVKILLSFYFLSAIFFANSQNFEILLNTNDASILIHRLELKSFKFTTINSTKHVDFSKTHEINSLEKGAPQLPRMSTSIILSPKGKPQIVVTYDDYTDIPDIEVSSSKGNLKRNVNPAFISYEFGEIYQTDAFYPGKLAQLSIPFIARDIRGVTITVFPYQYNPVTKTLRVYENLKVKVINNPTETGQNEIVNSHSGIETRQIYRSLFLNGTGIEKYIPKEEVGDLLIICPAEMDSVVQILAQWKNQKGIKTKVVHTSETGFGVNNIKNYIVDYYNSNADFLYLLLVGDHEDIPAYTYGEKDGEQLWSDSFYGQLAGTDLYPELFVGRFSGNQQEISNMIQRTIEYEKNPLAGDWLQNALGLASELGTGIGLNGQADWEHMRNLRNDLVAGSYQEVYEFYDGSQNGNDAVGNPNSSMVISAINDGIGLINYTGHGDFNVFSTSGVTSFDVQNLINTGKYPWVISVACNHGSFSNGTCISEKWLRASKNGSPTGAIAACGSSILMSWAPPMKTQKEMVGFITNADSFNVKKTLGGIFYNAQLKMLEQYPTIEGGEVMQTWVFFGDPTVEFRTEQTLSINVSHVSQIAQSENSLTVTCDTENTFIAITQENILLGKGIIIGGATTIALPVLLTEMPLTITATKQNYKPYQGSVQVGNGPVGITDISPIDYAIFPNPANNEVQVKFSSASESRIIIVNSTGQVLKTIKLEAGSINESISLTDFAKGIYQFVIHNSQGRVFEKLVIQ